MNALPKGDPWGQALLSGRRKRSCPRAMRKPVSGWPRLLKRTQTKPQIHIKITS